ncbi:MAG: hypothetical protein Ta2C_07890 [Candidatus Endomicrobiellum trichonymphae]|uniref:hypothetical protein n=1 Tax=Endomicrobium trichonymphae TaxID=1408204 RepID=UPI0027D37BED|nr:MAG: hypothetical protein Ta2C_07890 [Candidatus Endomicrobium trichonymphae]
MFRANFSGKQHGNCKKRGIGIINVKDLFDIGNVLELVIKLEEWDPLKKYERLGINEYYAEFLSVKVPEVTIPIVPGRGISLGLLKQRLWI